MAGDAAMAMDRMYRHQRHVYDLTRKFYLLGRDRLIEELAPAPGESVCEVGCGTARNLIAIARRWPAATVCGIDASAEMLRTAAAAVARAGLAGRVALAQADATSFDPQALFGLREPLDHLVFSYSLSMIPPWREAIDHGLTLLRPGGSLRVVDFGDQAGLPAGFRRLLFAWLGLFGVQVRPEMPAYLASLGAEMRPLYRGYAWSLVLRRP